MKPNRRRFQAIERLENRCLLSFGSAFTLSSNFDEVAATEFNLRDANGFNLPGTGRFIEIGYGETIQIAAELDDVVNQYLRVAYEQNEDLGMAYVPLSTEGYRPNRRETIQTSQWMMFEAGFDFAIGQKIHRLYATDGNTNEFDILLQVHAGPLEGLSERDMTGVNDSKSVVLATNHSTENGRADWSVGGDFQFERGRWYKIDVELVLNTPGQPDGAARFWIDDNLIGELENVSIRGNSTYGVNRVGFGGWYSNAAGGQNPAVDPANESVLRIDDIQVSYFDRDISVNVPPVVTPAGPFLATVDEQLTFQIEASDESSAAILTYTMLGEVPEFAFLDNFTGEFIWTPGAEDQGKQFKFQIQVADNEFPPQSTTIDISLSVEQEVSYQLSTDEGTTRLYIIGTDRDDDVAIEDMGDGAYQIWANRRSQSFTGVNEILVDLAGGENDQVSSLNNSIPDLNRIYNTELVWLSTSLPVVDNEITPSLIRESVGLRQELIVAVNSYTSRFIERLTGWTYAGVERVPGLNVGHRLESAESNLIVINSAAQNPIMPLDVSGDGSITPIDVVRVINELNRSGPRVLVLDSVEQNGFLLDVNGDSRVTPIDVLIIVNHLNRGPRFSDNSTPAAYRSFDGQDHQLYAYEGKNVRILAQQPSLNIADLIAEIDRGYDAYFTATGRHPNNTDQSIGKTIIAQVPTCGAGCGLLGSRGVEIDPAYFDAAVAEFAISRKPDHIFYYEFGRNFWFYDDKLEFNRNRPDHSERGSGDYMVNGFPIFMERAISEFLGIQFSGAGAGANDFWESNARWLSGYLADANRDYSTDFANFSTSLYTDPISGIRLGTMDFLAEILLDVARNHGEMEFVNRLWREVGQRNDWRDEASAIGNLISSASMAAGQDLVPLFRDVYKWPISEEANLYAAIENSNFADFEGGTLSGIYRTGLFESIEELADAPGGIERHDGKIDFEWDAGSPLPGFQNQRFTVDWSGELFLPAPGTYEFEVFADDGIVLYVGDQLVIDSWVPQRTTLSGSIDVTAEMVGPVPIRLYYYENGGSATISLSWSSLHFSGIIPEEYLSKTSTSVGP